MSTYKKLLKSCGRIFSPILSVLLVVGFFPVSALAASTFQSVAVGSQSGSVNQGVAGSVTYTVTVSRTGSGNLDVVMSISGLPTGATSSFSPSTVSFTGNTPTSNTSTLTINTTSATPSGSHSFTIQGVAGAVTKTSTGTLTVGAPDTTAPVITLTGSDPVTVEGGSVYTDAGATATDNVDSSVTVITTGTVDTNTVGAYVLHYNATDSSGNHATEVTRTVNVVDTTAPVIALNGSNPQTVLVGQSYVEGGATVTDNIDSSLTATIDSGLVDINTVGSYLVKYDAVDTAGNHATQVTRTVNVVDQEAPVITLVGANPQIIEVGTAYSELGATVADNVDSGLVATINSSAVNTSTIGSYTVTYDATDLSENSASQVTRTVNVVDTTVPVITLTGDSIVNVVVDTSYSDAGATATDNVDGDRTSFIITTNPVDIHTIGTYTVRYNVADTHGNNALEVTRTVNVVEALPTTGGIVFVKDVVDSDGETNISDDTIFTINVVIGEGNSSKDFGEGSNAEFYNLAPGAYSVNESSKEGYSFVSLTPNSEGSVIVSAGATTTITIVNKRLNTPSETPEETNTDTQNTSIPGGHRRDIGVSGGRVLGASTDGSGNTFCDPLYLTKFLRKGENNDASQVKRLQEFLNENLTLSIPTTGFFGNITENAVKKFQVKYQNEILAPWVKAGLRPSTEPTGYVYKTTQRQINLLVCPSATIPEPTLP